jgi:hypothetical protein
MEKFTWVFDKGNESVSGITRSIFVHLFISFVFLVLGFSFIHSNVGVHLKQNNEFFLFVEKKFYLFSREHQWQRSTFEHSLHVIYCSHVLKFCLIN